MPRLTGYLAQLDNIPPIIFRFQFNPEMLQEKRSYKYEGSNEFGKWDFSRTSAASGKLGTALGIYNDLKGAGPVLTGANGMKKSSDQDPRELELEFKLDATMPGPMDGDPGDAGASHYNGSIEPDLAMLRAFVNPAWEPVDLVKALLDKQFPCPGAPPEVKFIYAGLSIDCVMTELNIKHTEFQDDGKPLRAEVSLKLKEQSYSVSPIIEYATRSGYIVRGAFRHGGIMDVVRVTPGLGGIVSLFE